MAQYRPRIESLDDISNYTLWSNNVLAYFGNGRYPEIYGVITSPSAADIALMQPAEKLVAEILVAQTAGERAQFDRRAQQQIVSLLGPELGRRFVRIESGRGCWDALKQEFLDYQRSQAPIFEQQLRALLPRAGETVAAYCDRARNLAENMQDVGRPVNEASLVDAVLNGLASERAAWRPVLLGLRGAMDADVTLRQVRARLVEAESRSPDLAPAANHALAADSGGPPARDRIAALEGLVHDLLIAVRPPRADAARAPVVPPAPRGPPPGARTRRCYRCNSLAHSLRDCPHPAPYDAGALSPPPILAYPELAYDTDVRCSAANALSDAGGVCLDSGCNVHMHPGAGGAAQPLLNYRPFEYPLPVRFGKRGVVADAVGDGDYAYDGPSGPVVFQNVLHVPELDRPLFSVSTALNAGMSVHFKAPPEPGGAHRVLLIRAGRVVLTASHRAGLYFLDAPCHANTAAVGGGHEQAWRWHRNLGHMGFSTLADLRRKGMLDNCTVTPAKFLQMREHVCEPCVVGKLRRTSHPPRAPVPIRVLGRVHMDLMQIPGWYVATMIDEATRHALVSMLPCKSATATAVRNMIVWSETQTDLRVQRVRHDRGGEYMVGTLTQLYAERGIQKEPTAPYSPESNGIAERHNKTLLDKALPMLADSGDSRHGLEPLGQRYMRDAVIYANDLHNATPSSVAQIGRTPHEGFLRGRVVRLAAFRRFGCRVWVHNPGGALKYRHKNAPRGLKGRFLGFEQPLGSGVYRVLMDDGSEMKSQTVVFDDAPFVPLPAVQSPAALPVPFRGGDDDDIIDARQGPALAPPALPALAPPALPALALPAAPPAPAPPADAAPQLVQAPVAPADAEGPQPAQPLVAPAVPADPPPQEALEAPAAPAVPPPALQADPPADQLQMDRFRHNRRHNAGQHGPRFDPSARLARVRWADPLETVLTSRTRGARVRVHSQRSGGRKRLDKLQAHRKLQAIARKRRKQRRPRRGKKGRGSGGIAPEAPPSPQPFYPPRSGGTSRGATARLRKRLQRPPGRLGMQPLHPHCSKPCETSPPVEVPRFSPRRPVVRAPSHSCEVRADLKRFAMAAAVEQPDYREPDPLSVADALSRPDAAKWQEAIDQEVASCLEYGVWEECLLPPGKNALPSRFVLERKRDGRYKARLVAGGHRQQHGLDFEETYAPVCSYRTMRMILATCAHEDLEMRQFDIRTAFLNGELEEEVYIRTPAGAGHLARAGRVLRLLRALYGLRQASRAWNKRLEAALVEKGFKQSDADPSLWILHGDLGAVLAMFYVDDGLVAARTAAEADALVDLVASMFAIRALGEPEDFLGIEITRDRRARTITIDQSRKARALAEGMGVLGQRKAVPMSPDVFAGLKAALPGEQMGDLHAYQSAIGSLLHLAQCTRPDIALPVGALAAYNAAPSQAHFDAMLDLVRYVGSTAERGITYGHTAVPLRIWCDANFATCLDTRRSITGWAVVMYGGAVSWSSKKQPTTAASTMDAEYQACGAVAREGLSLLKALDELALLSSDFPIQGPLPIKCDNKAALSLCNDRKEGQRVKHIDIIHHFARDHVASGELQFIYCRSADNVSDCFTKALARPALEACLAGLGMLFV